MLSLVWFRRDLRLHDHAALATALASPAPLQPIFILDTEILARFTNPRDRRLSFILRALCRIDQELRTRGGGLLVLHGKAGEVVPKLAATLGASAIFSAEDFEPATRARDAAVKQAFGGNFVQVVDHLMRAPYQVRKEDGTPFKIFTPYYKRWLASLNEMDWQPYPTHDQGRYTDIATSIARAQAAGLCVVSLEAGAGGALAQIGYEAVEELLWPVDDAATILHDFLAQQVARYDTARDIMAQPGTSKLSPYLRHGLVSIRECMCAAKATMGSEKWVSELAWREFYAQILYHWPEVVTQEFMPQYRDGAIPWNHAPEAIAALHEAKTGYPIIDAALRELLETGWMHNRARMIVACFFTKDLLLDWRIGEEFFAQHLMDYDLASNNGGWQWAASTGTDASPYFRVFNPLLQSKKFDPNGTYIRRYLPELAGLKTTDIHWPHGQLLTPRSYPAPVVDHALAKQRVVAVFKAAGLQKQATQTPPKNVSRETF